LECDCTGVGIVWKPLLAICADKPHTFINRVSSGTRSGVFIRAIQASAGKQILLEVVSKEQYRSVENQKIKKHRRIVCGEGVHILEEWVDIQARRQTVDPGQAPGKIKPRGIKWMKLA